ncbi:hypothetical protein DSCO28_26040 [Desulfosarcina ovata subsp. sediminis]|uniref:Uncharacterized protein n=1 Tax=Desulfosarcina ovata subsp. sediminis TaxID=885957 RepID=A0A5K7ZII7_9BACT|nr:hypothetical protein [Desulfosarcina ovata]BBO82038.1 hypothetical protein DSCO28_26040 [Desulfosarcina ovata subsp. sediminis]
MKEFGSVILELGKNVEKNDNLSLLKLFRSKERYKSIEALLDLYEDTPIKVVLQGLGEIELKLGNDIEKGQKKNIMTIFAYDERAKPIEIENEAKAGDNIIMRMFT